MFPEMPFTEAIREQYCWNKWRVKPRVHWLQTNFWGKGELCWLLVPVCYPVAVSVSRCPAEPHWGQAQHTESWQKVTALCWLELNKPFCISLGQKRKTKTTNNLFKSSVFPVLGHVCCSRKHIWITGQEGDLSFMNSFNFRPEKCKQHHFFKWRLGSMGWWRGKHVHSYTLSTEQPLQVTYCFPSLSEQHWQSSFYLRRTTEQSWDTNDRHIE